jgi:hypothetical protein
MTVLLDSLVVYMELTLKNDDIILFLLSSLTFFIMFDRSSYSKYLFKYVVL